jgi:hypothetical protein
MVLNESIINDYVFKCIPVTTIKQETNFIPYNNWTTYYFDVQSKTENKTVDVNQNFVDTNIHYLVDFPYEDATDLGIANINIAGLKTNVTPTGGPAPVNNNSQKDDIITTNSSLPVLSSISTNPPPISAPPLPSSLIVPSTPSPEPPSPPPPIPEPPSPPPSIPEPTPTQPPTLPSFPQQFSATYNGTTFQGYYQLPENPTTTTDVILAFGGTVRDTSLVMDNALTQLNVLRQTIGITNKTIVAIAYPQNVLMAGTNNNIPEAEAALLWLKSNPVNILGVNVNKIFLFGHSQGGYIVARLNTMYQTNGVISSAPGPINLQIKCELDETIPYSQRNRDCNALFDVYGSATGPNQQEYINRSLISFTTGHKSKALYIQGLGDTAFQVARYNEYINSLNACTNCAPYTQVLIPAYGTLNTTTGERVPNNHVAYGATEQGKQAIRNFLNNN